MAQKVIIAIVGIVLILVFGVVFFAGQNGNTDVEDRELAVFAECLAEKGAVFYGAFWCPHCQDQKEMFGNAEKSLLYVECSTLDGREQLAVCSEKGIKSYPTWEFADGSREEGVLAFERLSLKTGCALPIPEE